MELNRIWRLQIRPQHARGALAEQWCFRGAPGGRAGIGWGLPVKPSTVAEAFEMAELYYSKDLHTDSWKAPYDAFLNQCRAGDLIWARSSSGPFFLGQVTGDWDYDESGEARRAGIFHWRPCAWRDMGTLVPGAVSRFFSTADTLASVEGGAARYFSARSWNEHPSVEPYALPESRGLGYFDFLDQKGLEALVASWLQLEKGYYLMPNPKGLRGPSHDPGMFISRADGGRAVAYASLENFPVRMSNFRLLQKDTKAFVFAPQGRIVGDAPDNVEFISKQELLDFVDQYREVLPKGVAYWNEYVYNIKEH